MHTFTVADNHFTLFSSNTDMHCIKVTLGCLFYIFTSITTQMNQIVSPQKDTPVWDFDPYPNLPVLRGGVLVTF